MKKQTWLICELPTWWKCTQRLFLTKLGGGEIWKICLCQKFFLKRSCWQSSFLKDWSRKCVSTFFFTNFTFYILQHRLVKIKLFKSPKSPKTLFSTSPTSTRFATFQRFTTNLGNFIVASLIDTAQSILKLELWSPRNALRHSFPQAVWPQETLLLKALTPILAIEMSHHWLMHHNLFWNWSSEDPKTSKNSFSTRSVGTRNTAFEWSRGNLENLKNVKCRICDQNGTQQICDSKNVESRICEKKRNTINLWTKKGHNQSVTRKM